MATLTPQVLLTADQFLEIEFGPDIKAELDSGVIRMMGGGTAAHARISGNIFALLKVRLRGSGCMPFNSDMAVRTHVASVRYPDVAVYCGQGGDPADDHVKAFDAPKVIFEVLSQGTARTDLRIKLEEYRALPSVDTIVFVDAARERLRIVRRTGPGGWSDITYTEPIDLGLPSLDLSVEHDEIFARD